MYYYKQKLRILERNKKSRKLNMKVISIFKIGNVYNLYTNIINDYD